MIALSKTCLVPLLLLLLVLQSSIGFGSTRLRMKITVKKTRAICGGQAQIHGPTYGPTLRPDMKDLRLFFALATLENKLIYGAGVSNVFAAAAAPVQQYFMRVNVQFCDWWFATLKPLVSGAGWSCHIDNILQQTYQFIPTVHDAPCIYCATINKANVLFLCQVDDLPLPLSMNSFTPKFATLLTPTSLYP